MRQAEAMRLAILIHTVSHLAAEPSCKSTPLLHPELHSHLPQEGLLAGEVNFRIRPPFKSPGWVLARNMPKSLYAFALPL